MEHTVQINQQYDVVFDYLTDMQKYQSLNPAVIKVVDLGNGKYTVHKRLKFVFIPYYFSFPMALTSDEDKLSINMVATIGWLNRLEVGFRMIPMSNYTIVEEIVTWKSLIPIGYLLENSIKKQHKILFKNINDLPED